MRAGWDYPDEKKVYYLFCNECHWEDEQVEVSIDDIRDLEFCPECNSDDITIKKDYI